MKTAKHVTHLTGSARAVLSGPVARSAVGLATVAGVAGGIVGVAGAGTAAADPVSLTLKYTCSVRSIAQPATIKVRADVPKKAVVGKPTPRFVIHAGAPVSADVASGLNWIGVKTVEGTVDAKARVIAPKGNEAVVLPFAVPRTSVPKSGPFHVKSSGKAPARTFSQPGKAKITVGDLVLHAVPRNASGEVFPDKINVPCKLDPGQNNVVASFDITRAGTPSGSEGRGSTAGGTAHPTASGSTGSTGPSGSSSDSNSADKTRNSTQHGEDGVREDTGATTARGSAGPSGSTAATGSQGTQSLIPLAVGALVVGALVIAAAFRFRSRGR